MEDVSLQELITQVLGLVVAFVAGKFVKIKK